MKKSVKITLIIIFVIFVVIQMFRPDRISKPVDTNLDYISYVQITPELKGMIDRACKDCHTYQTEWPWYSNIAPVSWFIVHDVNEGREHINLSEYGRYPVDKQIRILEEMCEEIQDNEMPLKMYKFMHSEAKLTDEEKQQLCEFLNPNKYLLKKRK